MDPDVKMLHHFIFPDYPVLANSTALWTTFGPMRAVNTAEMAVKHLCVNKRLTEEEMVKAASWNLSGSSNALSGWLFQSQTNSIKTFVKMHLDLLIQGHVNILDFLHHVFEVFCLARQTPLRIRLPLKEN